MSQDLLVGIDLGTTYSCVAYLDEQGKPVTVMNREEESITPSAILFDTDSIVVGTQAVHAAVPQWSQVALNFKRSMGEPLYENGRQVAQRSFRPETLSAIVLQKLRQDTEQRFQKKIAGAVITVPAYFDDARRYATRLAGELAGLPVLDLLNEPTAAALAHTLAQVADGRQVPALPEQWAATVLVYDLGGGTFDASVVRLNPNRFEVLATNGDVELGGRDWDQAIVDHLAELFLDEHDLDPRTHPEALAELNERVEQAKRVFFTRASAKVPIPVRCEGKKLSFTLDLETFENLTAGLLLRTQITLEHVISQAKLDWSQLDQILMVGGSTRMPAVARMLRQVTGKEPTACAGVQEIVAHGAALYAGMLASRGLTQPLRLSPTLRQRLGGITKLDVNPVSIGVRATKRLQLVNDILIPQNQPLPRVASKVYYLPEADLRSIRVRILEGEAPEAAAATLLGECRVEELPPQLPKGAPIQVRLKCKEDGIIEVLALDMTGGRLAKTVLERRSAWSEQLWKTEQQWLAQQHIL